MERKKPANAPPVGAQTAWFQRNKGLAIAVRLMDGTAVEGVLLAWDTYTIAMQVSGHIEPMLVNKHAIALFWRVEELNAVAG